MKKLIDEAGRIRWGIYDEPVDMVNYPDYDLQTPMGLALPKFMRRILANQFHFIGVVGPEVIVGLAVVDLKYISSGFFYLYDRIKDSLVETTALSASPKAAKIRPTPESPLSTFETKTLKLHIDGTTVSATGKGISMDIVMETAAVKPLRICTRAGYRGWAFTQKTSPVPAKGYARAGDRTFEIESPHTKVLMDWTCGYMRRKTCWNWAASATTLPDGRSLGLNLSCGVNETSFTENGFWIDGVLTKVDMVNYVFDSSDLMKPWHITSFDQKVDLTFRPKRERHERLHAGIVASRFSQLIGVFEGTLMTVSGELIELRDCPGFAEDHYAKW